MNKVEDIDDIIDKAIIKAFECPKSDPIRPEELRLLAGAIKDVVREKFSINDAEAVQSRIRKLYERGILVEFKPGTPRKDNKRVYALQKNLDYNYLCGLLPGECTSREIPKELRMHHTEMLQEAIRNWIAFFPEPKAEYPFDSAYRYQDDVKRCRSHKLFSDLENHLPQMDCDVWKRWGKYIEDLIKLQKKKEELLSLIKNEISNCFSEFNLRFVSDLEYDLADYECNLIHMILYEQVINLSGRISIQDAYNDYERCIAYVRENTLLVDGESTTWRLKGTDDLIKVPKEKHEALEDGIKNFLNLLGNIEKPQLIKPGEELMKRVTELKQARETMIRDLEDTLQYYSFLGECKYLSGF